MKIESLLIENFRGVRRLNLDVQGQNLIIVGENGSGKSSIIDALEYYFTGRVDKFMGRADVKARKSIPHLKGGPTRVAVRFSGFDEPFAVPYPRGTVKKPRALKSLFEMASDHPFVLRRSQILDFINARPGERYQELSKIVGLGELDKMDRVWRRQQRDAEKEVQRLQRVVDEAYDDLSETLIAVVRTEQELLDALDEWLLRGDLQPVQRRAQIPERMSALREKLRSHADRDAVAQLRQAQAEITTAGAKLDELLQRQESIGADLQRYWQSGEAADGAAQDARWERLLAEGHRLLHGANEVHQCPLCETPLLDGQAFMGRLAERVKALEEMTRLRRQIRQEANGLAGAVGAFRGRLACVAQTLQENEVALLAPEVKEIDANLQAWQTALQGDRFLAQAMTSWGLNGSVQALQSWLAKAKIAVQQQLDRLHWDDKMEGLYELLQKLAVVDEQWQRLELARAALAQAETVCRQVSVVYHELIDARIRGVDRLRRELEADFDRFYQQLHPDEGYEAISIAPQENKRSSVELTARFHDQEPAHPLGFWSEGHLDSLGLCVFLAFISRYNNGFSVIALDDVLTTVDAGHRLRVARLLAREFSGQQLVITTHDQLWAKQLQSVLPNSQLVPLKRWSFDRGADYQQNVLSDWAYYEQQARAGRAQDAIAGAGRNLEKFLYQMRGNLGLAVPARPNGDYGIGDLFPAFLNWVRGHTIERTGRPTFQQELNQVLEELEQVWRLRNWAGAHFNEWASTVTAEEAVELIDVVRELTACFECPVCQNLVIYNRQAGALICTLCDPAPPQRIVWQYDPRWLGRAERIQGRPGAGPNLLKMSTAYFEYFLQDMRRRVHLAVPARADEQYTAADLYPPLLRWAKEHAREGVPDWKAMLEAANRRVLHFRENGDWQVVRGQEEAFFDAVRQFIELFACGSCAQLMGYEDLAARYYCPACEGQDEVGAVSAFWFVR